MVTFADIAGAVTLADVVTSAGAVVITANLVTSADRVVTSAAQKH